jgi:methyl-accepting chemotaxis protein
MDAPSATNRISSVAEATTHMFTALHNLRVDRATTSRDLGAEQPVTMTQQLREVRAADLPALKAALVAMERVRLPRAADRHRRPRRAGEEARRAA